MKNTVLFGAGQVGLMVSRLLSSGYWISSFADNAREKWGGDVAGIPVLSPAESLQARPDCVVLCVTGEERAAQMEAQLRTLGYAGPVLRADALRVFDARLATMRLLAEQIRACAIPGDLAELGVYRGDFAACINAAFPSRRLHLFDTFSGFDKRDVEIERSGELSRAKAGDFCDTSAEAVLARLPRRDLAVLHAGWFPETFSGLEETRFAFVSIDADLYAPTAAALPLFWDRLSPGGALLIHDVNGAQFTGAGKAVREFCAQRALFPMPVCDLHGSVVLRREAK